MTETSRACESTRYARGACTEDGPKWDVVYWTRARDTDPWREFDRHPACFRHGLAEVDRAHAAAQMARCELREAGQP